MKKRIMQIGLSVLTIIILLVGILHLFIKLQVVGMPGNSYSGPVPSADPQLQEQVDRLRSSVEALAYDRSIYNPEGLAKAANWVEKAFGGIGFNPNRQDYLLDAERIRQTIEERSKVGLRYEQYDIENQQVTNFWVRIPGKTYREELLVVGAHYDTVSGSPGAYDNAAGIACLLEIARQLLLDAPEVSVILAAFTCEEHPASVTDTEGSGQFAEWLLEQRTKAGLPLPFGMISLDTLGNFSDEPGSQRHPFPLQYYFPSEGNFVAFVGDYPSRSFITQMVGRFREQALIPCEGLSIPQAIVPDVMRSDHSPFIERGIPGLMVTDTANFRVPNPYHSPEDTPEKINYLMLAHIVDGLAHAIREAKPPEPASLHGGDKGIGLGD